MNRLKKNRILAVIAILVILFSGISLAFLASRQKPAKKEEQSVVQNNNVPSPELVTLRPLPAWYNQKEATYYDLGAASPGIAKSYVLVTGFDTNDNPVVLPNQYDILDSKRGDENYSDFRQVVFVTVPKDYTPNSVKSVAEIANRNWPIKETGIVENRPQVLPGTKIEPDRLSLVGWVNNQEIYFWIFENSLSLMKDEQGKVLISKLYIPMRGNDEQGNPIKINDQRDIVDSVPGEKEYSPLREVSYVRVPNDYKTNSLKSVDDIKRSGYPIVDSDKLINGPVYEVEGKVVAGAQPQSPPITEEKKTQPSQSDAATRPSGAAPKLGYDQIYPSLPGIPAGQYYDPSIGGDQMPVGGRQPVAANNETRASEMEDGQARAISQELPQYYNLAQEDQEITQEQVESTGVTLVPPQVATVSITNYLFEPSRLQITAPTAVTWINNDSVPHTVTADSSRFSSGIIWPGQKFTMIFTEPGVRYYHCSLHPEMKGILIVQSDP